MGLELGFSSSLKSEGTTAAVNIDLTEDYKLTSWYGGIPTIRRKTVFINASSPIICICTPVDGYHCCVEKFPVCFLSQRSLSVFAEHKTNKNT